MSSSSWQQLLLEPENLTDDVAHARWFDAIARRMLCGCRLTVGTEPHRFTEIEFYYHGGTHLDTFTHRDPLQRESGLWYFHRTAGVYRSGSFKGIDLTFGGTAAFGGVLIRGVELPNGELVDGPSLTVDHLLRRTGAASVAALDETIAGRPAREPGNPLHLTWLPQLEDRPILSTARVGLSLKRLRKSELPPRYIMRRYRFLSEPRRISKGKAHMVLALHGAGVPPDKIREQLGCAKGAMQRYIADYEEGRKEANFDAYFGADIGPKELCQLHGIWQAKFGQKAE